MDKEKDENQPQITEEAEVNHRIKFIKTISVNPDELKQHPVNDALYDDGQSVDLALVENIRKKGLVEPLIIKEDNTIISGHRRWRALKHINEKQLGRIVVNSKDEIVDEMPFVLRLATCHVAEFKSVEEEQLAIVEYNRRRAKRMSQMYNEIEMLHDIFDGVAASNSKKNLKQNTDPQIIVRRLKEAVKNGEIDGQEIDWSLTPSEIACHYGHLVGGPKFTDKEEYNKSMAETNTKIGKILGGISRGTVANLTEVGRLAKNFDDPCAKKAMELMDRGIWRIGSGYKYVWLRKKVLTRNEPGATIAKDLIRDIDEGIKIKEKKEKGTILSPAAAVEEFKKLVYEEEELTPSDLYSGPVKCTYNILYFDFPSIERDNITDENVYELPNELKEVYTPTSNNSAIFIAANSINLTQASLYLTRWGYKLRSYVPLGTNEILLIATSGTRVMPKPENMPKEIIREKSIIPQLIRAMYPEEESFWEINLDKNHKQPEGWGKSLETLKAEQIEAEKAEVKNRDDEEHSGAPAAAGGW